MGAAGVTRIVDEAPLRFPLVRELDGVRAVAVAIVFLSHIGLGRYVPGGLGVTIFFFLSGYLITTLLRREMARTGDISLRRFYLRRTVRILPPMYLTILFFVILSGVGLLWRLRFAGLPYDLFFLSNYISQSGMPIGLWSLAVEEHFYLAFPLLLLLIARRVSFERCALFCLGLCALVFALRLSEARDAGNLLGIAVWTHTRVDSILYGAILALWNNPVADRGNALPTGIRGYLLAALLLLPTFLIRDEIFRQTLRYTLQGIGLLVLFNTAIRDRGIVAGLLDNVATRLIARWSYTLYLVHSGLIAAITGRVESEPSLGAAVAILLSIGYAMLMWRFVEKPLGGWRQRQERAMIERDTAAADRPAAEPAVHSS